jgi:hypothetical protein
MSLSMVAKKGIRDNEAQRDAHLKELRDNTKVELTVVPPDWAAIIADKDYMSGNYKEERVGFVIYSQLLGNLVSGMIRSFKDDMIKEGFLEKCTAKKVCNVFELL